MFTRKRDALYNELTGLYHEFLRVFPDYDFTDIMHDRYGVKDARLMSLEELDDLVHHIKDQLDSAA